jgi:dolichol-phosphate mannosyltransferase
MAFVSVIGVSRTSASRFVCVGLVGLVVDFLLFETMFLAGFRLVTAHVTSFAVVTIFNYVLNTRWVFTDAARVYPESSWRLNFRFLTISLLALALRGGVLASAVELLKWPPQVAIVLAVGVAAVVYFIGNALFVLPSMSARVSPNVRWRILAICVLAYVIALRLAFVGLVDLLPEEAYYWNYAQHLDIGYLDHPPMVAWLIWAGTSLFGDNEFGVRIAAFVCWLATAYFAFALTRNLFGNSAALANIVLVSSLPFFFFIAGMAMMPDAPLTAAWAGALYFLERALISERRWAWLGVGICLGLGMLSKYTIALLGPATLVFVLFDLRARRWLCRPEPYVAIAIAAILFTPVIVWNALHDWASFAFQGSRRVQGSFKFSLPELIGAAILLLTPFGLIHCISELLSKTQVLRTTIRSSDTARISLFMVVYTLVPVSVFFVFSLFHPIKLNWTGPIWLAILPAVSATIAGVGGRGRYDGVIRRLWVPTIAATLVIYGIGLHYIVLGVSVTGYPLGLRTLPVAWQEFGREAGSLARNVEAETGKQPLLIGMDLNALTSELAFYNRESPQNVQNSVGRGILGRDALMYGFWFCAERMRGRDAILFAMSHEELLEKNFVSRFERLGEVEERKVLKDGKLAGRFFYRIGYSFRPRTAASACPK